MELHDIIFVTVLLVISVVTIIGNVLVILAVYTHRRLQTPANYLIVNLAISDFFQGALSMPIRAVELLNTSNESLIRCDLVISASILFHGASNLNLALIAMDRFFAVFTPFAHANFAKTSNYKFIFGIVWFFVVILASCPVLGWRRDEFEMAGTVCRYNAILTREYLIFYVFVIDLVPLLAMFVAYTYIFRTTRKQIRQIRAQETAVKNAAINLAYESRRNSEELPQNGQQIENGSKSVIKSLPDSANNNRTITDLRKSSTVSNIFAKLAPLSTVRSRKATRTVLAIIGFFFVLCLPISIIDTIELFCCNNVPKWVTTVALWMVSANACVNVFVYGGYNKDYRKAYTKVGRQAKEKLTRPCCCASVKQATKRRTAAVTTTNDQGQ